MTRNYRMQLSDWKTKVKVFILEKLSKYSMGVPILRAWLTSQCCS